MKISLQKLYFLLFCLPFLISCDKDEDLPRRVISFTNKDTSSSYWVVLSDDTGNVIDWKLLTDNSKEELSYSIKEKVTVTTIRKTKEASPYYQLRTFTHVEEGDYSLGFPEIPQSTPIGSFEVNLPGDFNFFFPQSEGNCGIGGDFSRMIMSMCEDPSNLYMTLVKYNATPRYYYDSEIHPGEKLDINNDLYDQAPQMKNQIVSIAKPGSGYTIVEGNTIRKKNAFLTSITYTSFNTTSINFYYPDLAGSLFSDFNFGLYYSTDKNIYNYATRTSKEPIASWPALDVNFNFPDSTKISNESLEFPLTGNADYIFIPFNYYDNSLNAWWYVSTEFSNAVSVKLPVFPDDLKTNAGLSFISKMKKMSVSFVENKGEGGYSGFYKNKLNANKLSYVPYDIREKVYVFNSFTIVSSSGRVSNNKNKQN